MTTTWPALRIVLRWLAIVCLSAEGDILPTCFLLLQTIRQMRTTSSSIWSAVSPTAAETTAVIDSLDDAANGGRREQENRFCGVESHRAPGRRILLTGGAALRPAVPEGRRRRDTAGGWMKHAVQARALGSTQGAPFRPARSRVSRRPSLRLKPPRLPSWGQSRWKRWTVNECLSGRRTTLRC